MREENHFRVKGENIGQLKVIFRKITFSVTAKHVGFVENDFWKRFSPNSNTTQVLQLRTNFQVFAKKKLYFNLIKYYKSTYVFITVLFKILNNMIS